MKIHDLADVQTSNIGKDTFIWQFAVVLKGAVIGDNCNINCHTFIENDVVIGNNVTVKSGVYLWDGIRVEDNVFIGPSVVFTNDLRPRSKSYQEFGKTIIKEGASIGANSTILSGLTIGAYSMSGIGSNIVKDIPAYALVYGNPATFKGWIDEEGNRLSLHKENIWKSNNGNLYIETKEGLKKIEQ
jgi:acetyltransferase-like isoleucine patch superfamily enzyme